MAATAIPGLDVTEGWPRDYPRNPRIPPGGVSSQASDWLGMRSAPPNMGPQAPAEGAAQRAFNGLRRAGSATADTVSNIPGAKWVGRAVKVAAPLAAFGAIAPSTDADSTARYAKRFGMSEPTGDSSVGDIAKFAGLRALGYASDLGSMMTGGLADRFYADKQPGAMPASTASAAPAAPTTPSPTDQRLAASTQASPASLASAPYVRAGNSFTGPNGGINDGLRIGITPGMNDEAYAREARARDIYSQAAETQKQLDNTTAPTPGMGGFRSTRLADPSGGSILGPSGSSLRPRDVRHMQDLQAQRDIAGMREGGEMARAGLGANTQMGVAGLSAQTQRDINERNVALGLRGQDVSLAGHKMTNAYNIANMLREQNNWAASHGLAVDEAARRGRQEGWSNLKTQLEGMFTTKDKEGKVVPDTDAVGTHLSGVSSAIGEKIAQLNAVPPDHPQYAQAQVIAKQLADKGPQALGEGGLQKLIGQLEVKRRTQMFHSKMNPFGGTYVQSNDPSDYAITGRAPGLLQDQYTLKGGGSVPVGAVNREDPGYLDLFGPQSTRLDIAKKQGVR